MKILLDNCVHRGAAAFFPDHQVTTAAQMGWAELSNGALLSKAAEQFDVLVTVDKRLRFEQNLAALPLPVIELASRDSRIEALSKLVPHLPQALARTSSFRFVAVHDDGTTETLAPKS